MLLGKGYKPRPEDNRMRNEGNVVLARKIFYEKPSKNLTFLIRNRFKWMNDYINPEMDNGIEIGAGIGVSKEIIKAKSYILSDLADHEWLDVKNVDALNTPFKDNIFDFIVSSNMIHHVPYPFKFLKEAHRILKPNGFLLIQEVNCSLSARIIMHLMRKEGYSFNVDVFDSSVALNDPDELWSGNNAIPNLLFDHIEQFQKKVPYFDIVKNSFSEFFIFLNSGGVTAKTFYVPLPYVILSFVKIMDDFLVSTFPTIFALQRQIVLQKKERN